MQVRLVKELSGTLLATIVFISRFDLRVIVVGDWRHFKKLLFALSVYCVFGYLVDVWRSFSCSISFFLYLSLSLFCLSIAVLLLLCLLLSCR